MEQQSYQCSILVNRPLLEAFAGINEISSWWANEVKGSSHRLNDQFSVHFGKTWSKFNISEYLPGKKIVWHTMGCHLDLLKNPEEWKNTDIIWELTETGGKTKIQMTHLGLVPGLECFEDCNKGWDFYLKESLFNFLENKKGLPGSGIMATVTVGGKTYAGTLFSKDQAAPPGSGDTILIDVKETAVEHVVSAYSAHILDDDFDTRSIRGNYYMLLQNPGGTFLSDLNEIVN